MPKPVAEIAQHIAKRRRVILLLDGVAPRCKAVCHFGIGQHLAAAIDNFAALHPLRLDYRAHIAGCLASLLIDIHIVVDIIGADELLAHQFERKHRKANCHNNGKALNAARNTTRLWRERQADGNQCQWRS